MGVEGGTSPLRIVRPRGAIKIIYIKFILSQPLVGAADPPPHGIRRSAPAANAAPLENDKSVIKEKADYLPIRQRVLEIVN